VILPLFGALLIPWAAAVASDEFTPATPEYSRIVNRSVAAEIVSDTVTWFAPPAMFSA
jgi:hypothetical protein